MKTIRRWQWLTATGLGLALSVVTGCQTWVPGIGMTLPSPRYLQHPPQYFPPSPAFPLSRELASQERIAAQATAGEAGALAVPPAPVVPPPPTPVP
jgi:hypothetical protein